MGFANFAAPSASLDCTFPTTSIARKLATFRRVAAGPRDIFRRIHFILTLSI